MEISAEMVGVIAILCGIFGLWIILHYVSKWKAQKTLTSEDENLLDELYDLARRLDDRMISVERIIQAENPNWRSVGQDPVETALEDRSERLYQPEVADRAGRRIR